MQRRVLTALVTALVLGACGGGTTSGTSGSTSAGITADTGSGTDGNGANGGSSGTDGDSSASTSTSGSSATTTSTGSSASSSTTTNGTSSSASSASTGTSASSSNSSSSSTSASTSSGSSSTTTSSTTTTTAGSSGTTGSTTGTSGTDLTCAQSTSTTVPADAYAIINSGGSVYAFLRDDTHWTVSNGSNGSTRTIAFPSGFSAMHVTSVELAPSGEQLVLFAASGTTPTTAAFFSAGTFSAPVALPANTSTVHADAQDHLFVVDGSNVLWDGSSGTFINRGGLPLSNVSNTYYGGYWAWNVAPNGRVYLAYIDSSQQFTYLMWLDAGALGWSTPINTIPQSRSTLAGLNLAVGRDASVHIAFTLVDTSGIEYGSATYYLRSPDGSTWGSGETLHNVETVNDINNSYGIGGFVALGYDTAQAFLEGYGEARYANRCGAPQPWYGWNWVALAADGSLSNNPLQMSVDENGEPAFLYPENGSWEVQQNQ